MSSYFSQHHHFQSKHRHDPSSFQPPSPPLSAAGNHSSSRNPNPFDPNLYVPSPSNTPTTFSESFRKDQGNMDFGSEELAALITGPSSANNAATPNSTSGSYDDYSRHPPHNIFDVSAPTPPTATSHHGHYPHNFSIAIPSHSHFRPGSSHHGHGPDSPFTANSPFSPQSEGGFAHHHPLPSPLPPLNINGHHPPGPGDDLHSSSPFVHHPPPLTGLEHHHHHHARPASPLNDSRSRSRSKPPMSAGGLGSNTTRSRMHKKRASMSGMERPHPSAIMIPSNGSRPNTSSDSAPLSAHTSGASVEQVRRASCHIPKRKKVLNSILLLFIRAVLAHEKRRRRRESHNAVERRRRDNINEKISELATLIPECLLDPATMLSTFQVFAAMASQTGEDDSKEPPVIKANKGMILRKSVDYIRYLQQLVTAQASRNRDLESQLQQLQGRGIGSSPSISSPHSSDSAPDIHNQNFHVFSDELMNGMGMVDMLHHLGPDDNDPYLNMQFTNGGGHGGLKSPTANQRFDGLETLHEHTNTDQHNFEGDGDMDNDNEGEMELDDASPSASAESPDDQSRPRGSDMEKEEAERGRARIRQRKLEEKEAQEVGVKKESVMDV